MSPYSLYALIVKSLRLWIIDNYDCITSPEAGLKPLVKPSYALVTFLATFLIRLESLPLKFRSDLRSIWFLGC